MGHVDLHPRAGLVLDDGLLPFRELCLTSQARMDTAIIESTGAAAPIPPPPPPDPGPPLDTTITTASTTTPPPPPTTTRLLTSLRSGRGAMPKKSVRFRVQAWSYNDKQPPIMEKTPLNYFTCTLGEAARWNIDHPHPFSTINDLIDEQAKELRQRPAVNFPGSCHGEDGRAMKSGDEILATHMILTDSNMRNLALTRRAFSRFHVSRVASLFCGHSCKTAATSASSKSWWSNYRGTALFKLTRVHSSMAWFDAFGRGCAATRVCARPYLIDRVR